jgi:hypothetical protein
VEVVRPASAEFRVAQMGDAAEHRRDPPARPSDRLLHLRERAGEVRHGGQAVEQLAHQIAAAVVEPRDVVGVGHDVLWCVLARSDIIQSMTACRFDDLLRLRTDIGR